MHNKLDGRRNERRHQPQDLGWTRKQAAKARMRFVCIFTSLLAGLLLYAILVV